MTLREVPIVVLRPTQRPVAWPWAVGYYLGWIGLVVVLTVFT